MLHQFDFSSKSFEIEKIEQVLNQLESKMSTRALTKLYDIVDYGELVSLIFFLRIMLYINHKMQEKLRTWRHIQQQMFNTLNLVFEYLNDNMEMLC